jgi:hypothetical protein
MFLSGGGLLASGVFKKILSIGYEFESHDLAKLSLSRDKKNLVNSDLTLRVLDDKISKNQIRKFDKNYLTVHLPMTKRSKTPAQKELEESEEKEHKSQKEKSAKDEEVDEYVKEYMEAFGEDNDEDDIDDLMELLEEEELEEQFRENEKQSYLEYFYERREKDSDYDKENIKFQLTNDSGETYFGELLDDRCNKLYESGISKNDMYRFKPNKGKSLGFLFSEELLEDCTAFSGLEIVVTYYKPKMDAQHVVKTENPNIILDTFTDSISRIIDHFSNLKKTKGTMMVATDKNLKYSPLGKLDNKRALFYKPGTNLFYLSTYDDKKKEGTKKLGSMTFVPQMTFRCNAVDAIEIMKEILKTGSSYKIGKGNKKEHKYERGTLKTLEKIADDLIAKHNTDYSSHQIALTSSMYKTLKTYMFFILYKVLSYVQGHAEILLEKLGKGEDKTYLKDYLTFASRHSNFTLYERLKEILNESYGISDSKEILNLFYQPDICKIMYEFSEVSESDYDENWNYKYGDAFVTQLKKTDQHYGDPLYSFSSYFEYFEDRNDDDDEDWFVQKKLDIYSTTFDLTDDKILMENRFFANEFKLFTNNILGLKLKENYMTLNDMLFMINKLYDAKKMEKMINMERNPFKKKLVLKCEPGTIRSPDFKCIHPKVKTNVKANAKVNAKAKQTKSRSKRSSSSKKIKRHSKTRRSKSETKTKVKMTRKVKRRR